MRCLRVRVQALMGEGRGKQCATAGTIRERTANGAERTANRAGVNRQSPSPSSAGGRLVCSG